MKTIRVVAAVIKENNRIFATARGYGEYKGMWEFPGGKIELGETPQEALQREICEELTADIAVGDLIYTIDYDYPTFHLSMDCFWCTIAQGELKLLEAEAGKWLSKEDLYSVNWLPADRQLIEQIQKQWDAQMQSGSQKTLDYYNQNADSFVKGTVGVEFTTIQDKFRALLPQSASILDFGCGSGRDTKYFLECGYRVEATDGSEELCRMASEYTGITVKQMLFQELDEHEKYDGIWACSSILHVPKVELADVLNRMRVAVKPNGVIYTSFKYSDFEGMRNGRHFTDFTEDAFSEFLQQIPQLQIEEYWITGDCRPGRGDERWLNLIIRRLDIP